MKIAKSTIVYFDIGEGAVVSLIDVSFAARIHIDAPTTPPLDNGEYAARTVYFFRSLIKNVYILNKNVITRFRLSDRLFE